jgi:hypothetical protein
MSKRRAVPPGTGEVLQLVAATVADKIKADLVRIPGAAQPW